MAKGFWAAVTGALGAAVLLGMGLGHFVTTPQKSQPVMETALMDPSLDEPSGAQRDPEPGPQVIRCTGCGPTLAERQMAADQGAWDPDGMIAGSADPVVRDYMAADTGEAAMPADAMPVPAMPVEAPPLPARAPPSAPQRLAAGEESSPAASSQPQPVAIRPTLAPAAAGQP